MNTNIFWTWFKVFNYDQEDSSAHLIPWRMKAALLSAVCFCLPWYPAQRGETDMSAVCRALTGICRNT